jgi:hypothetical protein
VGELFREDRETDRTRLVVACRIFFRKRLKRKTSNSFIVLRVMTFGAGGNAKPAAWKRRISNQSVMNGSLQAQNIRDKTREEPI